MRLDVLGLTLLAISVNPGVAAASVESAASLARMPVREVTVFKDGCAFVVHQGRVATGPTGLVVLDRLPTPMLGTFWPYSAERDVKLTSVTSSRRRVVAERTATDVRGLLEANRGAAVEIVDVDGKTIVGRVRDLPSQPTDELTADDSGREGVPVRGGVLLLETGQGTLALPLERVRSVRFKDAPAPRYASESFRNLMTLTFAWPDSRPRRDVEIGMAYVQQGLRWIPSYKVTLAGPGRAHLQLEATLVNELADLENVTANLVVGVPSFAFKGTVDPMALQEAVAQLGGSFDARSASGFAMSNAIMSQVAGADAIGTRGSDSERREGVAEPGPELAGAEKDEDLYVFTVRNVTLRKGERMVLPVAEYDLAYRDVYTLELPYAPPMEVRANANDTQQRELAKLLGAPRFVHVLRVTNSGHEPLTTAPALITSGDRVLGQGMMSYTPPSGNCDLVLTTAVDLKVSRSDRETGRVPDALVTNGSSYLRVDLAGTIAIVNRLERPVDIEVRRSVLGHADTAGQLGRVETVKAYDEGTGPSQPAWWGWYGWPGWWGSINAVGRFEWKTKIEAGGKLALSYRWHYFWR